MTTFAVVVTIIIAIIGVFKWKKTMESPIQTIERTGRKAWVEENREMWAGKFDDDILTDPAYSMFSGNIFHDDD